MTIVSILSAQIRESEGHPHLGWQRGNILLVNKLIFWKVAICFKFSSRSCHLESEIDCHFTRQGCSWSRQSWFCTYQHSLTKLGAWLRCHGLLVYSCLRTRTEAHPWIPIRRACLFCLLQVGPLPTSKMYCSSSQQLSLLLPSVLLLFLFSKNRCGYSLKFRISSLSHLPGQNFWQRESLRQPADNGQMEFLGEQFKKKMWVFQETWSQHLGPPSFSQEHLVN